MRSGVLLSSLLKQYLEERTHRQVIETEKGFIVYSFPDPSTVYIEDIFVSKDARNDYVATNLANEVIRIAKEKGCTRAMGTVVPSAKGANTSLQVIMSFGMRLSEAKDNLIIFDMEI